jgi:ribonuclease HI
MPLQKSDPIISTTNDIMRPAYNREPKLWVPMLNTEEWTKGAGSPPVVKGLIWYTDGSRTQGRGLRIPLGKYVTVFQAEIYAILDSVYETETNVGSEKYISICSDSQVALTVLQAAKTTSPLVELCRTALNDISPYHFVGLLWVPRHSGIYGTETATELASEGLVHHSAGPQPALGVEAEYKEENSVLAC